MCSSTISRCRVLGRDKGNKLSIAMSSTEYCLPFLWSLNHGLLLFIFVHILEPKYLQGMGTSVLVGHTLGTYAVGSKVGIVEYALPAHYASKNELAVAWKSHVSEPGREGHWT